MAEFIAGTEEEFIRRMNERAKELGMNNTNFINSYGLMQMATILVLRHCYVKELITKFPQVKTILLFGWIKSYIKQEG